MGLGGFDGRGSSNMGAWAASQQVYPQYGGMAQLGGQGLLNLSSAYGSGGWSGPPPQNSGQLPFQNAHQQDMDDLGALINEWKASNPRQSDLNTAGNYARQEAAMRGLDGGLAASLSTGAQGQVVNQHQQMRAQALQQLLGVRSRLASGIQQDEERRRMYMYALKAQQAQAAAAQRNAIFSTLGTIGGGLLGTFVPPLMPLGAAGGAALGGGLGTLLGAGFEGSGMFGSGY